MRVLTLLTLLTAFLLSVGVAPAVAQCSCEELDANSREDADAVFTGSVTAEEDAGSDTAIWTFRVDAVERGDVDDEIRVAASRSDDACGFVFGTGRRYRVYATLTGGDEVPYETNRCLGTVQVVSGDVTPPEEDAETPTPEPSPTVTAEPATDDEPDELTATGAPLAALAGAGLLSLAAGIAARRRS